MDKVVATSSLNCHSMDNYNSFYLRFPFKQTVNTQLSQYLHMYLHLELQFLFMFSIYNLNTNGPQLHKKGNFVIEIDRVTGPPPPPLSPNNSFLQDWWVFRNFIYLNLHEPLYLLWQLWTNDAEDRQITIQEVWVHFVMFLAQMSIPKTDSYLPSPYIYIYCWCFCCWDAHLSEKYYKCFIKYLIIGSSSPSSSFSG